MNTNEKDAQFLYSDDLIKGGKYAEFTMVIAAVIQPGGITYQNGRQTSKPTIRFEKTEKGWEIPKTQERILQMLLGRDRAAWVGKKITLHAAYGKTPAGDGPFIRVTHNLAPSTVPIGVRKWLGTDLTGADVGAPPPVKAHTSVI